MISLLAAGCRCSAQAAVLKFKFRNCLITPPIVVTSTTIGPGWVVSVLGGSNLHSATAVRTSAAAISSVAHNAVTVCHLAYSDVIDMRPPIANCEAEVAAWFGRDRISNDMFHTVTFERLVPAC